MNLHEYQSKTLLKSYQIDVPKGHLVNSKIPNSIRLLLEKNETFVFKSQIHAGGRGKGGGVIVCHTIEDAISASKKLLGSNLITPQTDSTGQPINKIIVEAGQEISNELYLGLLVDRATESITILASTEGGMDIEEVATNSPEKIIKQAINPLGKLEIKECHEVAAKIGLSLSLYDQFTSTMIGLYNIFTDNDANLIEINPLIITSNNNIMALDGKIDFDDNALYRNEEISSLRDIEQEDKKERSASEHQLNYISLDGSVGCMVNGAGLAMATMDLIEYHGGSPANFLDVGGGTTSERVAKAFEIIQSGKNVKAILVNIFGGIVRCDLIANGILQAIEKVGLTLPIVVRLEGTNAQEGLEILNKSNINIVTEADLTKAAKKIVEMAK